MWRGGDYMAAGSVGARYCIVIVFVAWRGAGEK